MNMEIKDIGGMAISFLVAIIAVTVIAVLLIGLQDETPNQLAAYGNQSLTWAGNNTKIDFDVVNVKTATVVLYNNGSKINQGTNYTITSEGITILNISPPVPQSEWVTSDLNASFSYYYGSAAYNATDDGLRSQNTLSSFFPLIALAAIGLWMIVIVIRFFRIKQ